MDFGMWVSNALAALGTGLGAVLKAALILVVGIVVATIVKNMIVKLLGKGKVGDVLKKLDGDAKEGTTVGFVGKLVYLLVFLLFVPSIFSALGMKEVASPVSSILANVWAYVPNIVAAVIVLIVGTMVAKLVRQLLVPVFDKLNINKLQEKAGIEVTDSAKLSSTLAYVVYVLILIPMVVMALDVLNISVISVPAMNMLNTIFGFIPNIFVALVIIIIGCMIAKFVGQIVTRLIASAGLDAKVTKLMENNNQKVVLSKLVGTIVQVVVVIFFVVEGINVLELEVLTNIGAMVIGYMPAVLSAVLIMVICFIASSMAEKAMKKNGFNTYAVVVKFAILTVGGFMVLSQLGIAAEIVNTAFKLVLLALAVAFAIAFGVGGKEFASNALKKLEENADKKDAE
ncbi:MAG: mechanosensitive ion channel [Lachnospiraceae bacterium]|nr:mechanosensitive ion channel [Lachnospiraceae bacterium]